MFRRRWQVMALTCILEDVHWNVAAKRFTERGAARTAKRWSDQGRQWGPFVHVLGYGYKHEDEVVPPLLPGSMV